VVSGNTNLRSDDSGSMTNEQLNQIGYGLPAGQTICFVYSTHSRFTYCVVKDFVNGHTQLFVRKAVDAPFVEFDFARKEGEEIVNIVAPHGVDWLVCLVTVPFPNGPGNDFSCKIVFPSGEKPTQCDSPPGGGAKVISALLGPAAEAGCFICVVSSFRKDGLIPTKRILVDYSIAVAGLMPGDFRVVEEHVAPRFR
jgi:hypothetical protein